MPAQYGISNQNQQNPISPKQVSENMLKCPMVHEEYANSQQHRNTSPTSLDKNAIKNFSH